MRQDVRDQNARRAYLTERHCPHVYREMSLGQAFLPGEWLGAPCCKTLPESVPLFARTEEEAVAEMARFLELSPNQINVA